MGRKSILDKLLGELEGIGDVKGDYLILYNFNPIDDSTASVPSAKNIRLPQTRSAFYRHLDTLFTRLEDGKKAGRQVVLCSTLHTAFAIRALLEHFKCKEVTIYRIEEII